MRIQISKPNIFVIIFILFGFCTPYPLLAKATIQGKVTEKKASQLKVAFTPHPIVVPQKGDLVEFSKTIKGMNIKARAGKGEVISISGSSVWVNMTENEPRLGLDAVIHATGKIDIKLLYQQYFNEAKSNNQNSKHTFNSIVSYHEKGNKDATAFLGEIYMKGIGLSKDTKKGLQLLNTSIELGSLVGHNTLGYFYAVGTGVEKDYAKAYKHFEISSNGGYAPGDYNFGLLYHRGIGVEKNHETAFKLFKKGADQNYYNALYMVGAYYEHGLFVQTNKEKAAHYYKKSHQLRPTKLTTAALKRLGESSKK